MLTSVISFVIQIHPELVKDRLHRRDQFSLVVEVLVWSVPDRNLSFTSRVCLPVPDPGLDHPSCSLQRFARRQVLLLKDLRNPRVRIEVLAYDILITQAIRQHRDYITFGEFSILRQLPTQSLNLLSGYWCLPANTIDGITGRSLQLHYNCTLLSKVLDDLAVLLLIVKAARVYRAISDILDDLGVLLLAPAL